MYNTELGYPGDRELQECSPMYIVPELKVHPFYRMRTPNTTLVPLAAIRDKLLFAQTLQRTARGAFVWIDAFVPVTRSSLME